MTADTVHTARTAHPGDNPATAADAVATFLRQRSPQILVGAVAIAWSLRLVLGGWSYWDLLLPVLIVALWPLQEWLIHVFILHARPRGWFWKAAIGLSAHEHHKHHADPWRLDLVFIPLGTYTTSLPLVVGFWWLVTPNAALWWTGVATYLSLALHYEWVHYLAHIRWCPPLRYYRRRVHLHRCHHFRNERLWWGVSMVGADRWLGTSADPQQVAMSPTRFTLGSTARARN